MIVKSIILYVLILLVSVSSVQSQSLKSISGNKDLVFKDSISKNNSDSTLNKKSTIKKETKKGDYLTISTGLFVAREYLWRDNNVPYTSLDLNIHLGSIIYLDLGASGLFFHKNAFLAAHGTLGVGIDIMNNKLFTYTGAGCFSIVPYVLAGFVTLRVNYKFTKNISAGIDNKFFLYGDDDDFTEYIYSIGLNFSMRANY